MAFREKLAWALLATIGIGFVAYWLAVDAIAGSAGWDAPLPALIPPLIAMCVLMTILAIAGGAAVAISAPRDTGAPADERDRAIASAATVRAYAVMSIGLGTVLMLAFLGLTRFQLVHAAVTLIVLAEAVRYASEAWSYRWGA